MSEWISVDDALPGYGDPVIIVANGVTQNVTFCLNGSDYCDDWFEPFHFHHDSESELSLSQVSFWMPLQEPPKE